MTTNSIPGQGFFQELYQLPRIVPNVFVFANSSFTQRTTQSPRKRVGPNFNFGLIALVGWR